MWHLRKIDARGYTLITVIAAMFVFGVASFVLGAVIARSIQIVYASEAGITAGYLAFQDEQRIMGQPFSGNIDPQQIPQLPQFGDINNYPGFKHAVEVADSGISSNLKKITVVVKYPVPSSGEVQKKLIFYRWKDQ